MLDGTLTATLQPEDLQVGDIIELSTTVESSDPIYRNHVEQSANAVYNADLGRWHFSAQWPVSVNMRLHQTEGLAKLVPGRDGNFQRIDLTLNDLTPPTITSLAPARFRRPRLIEMSDFRDWSELAAQFAPMYDKAARIPADSPLRAEIEKIRADSTTATARTEAALALVQGRVRYVALLMGSGNFTPADAASTWSRRFGDCKAKSALLVAILRSLDIRAEPVIVNVYGNDGLDQRLPMVGRFNHVIVRATIAGKSYWLDGTRTGDTLLAHLTTPDYDWGLPLVAGATLVRMIPEQLAAPSTETMLRMDARAGISLPAPTRAEIVLRGDEAYDMKVSVAGMNADARDQWMRDYWGKRYPFLDIKDVGQSYDPARREQRLFVEGSATMDWSGDVYWLRDSGVGYAEANFERGAKENPKAPYQVNFPHFVRSTETILLPPGVTPINEAAVDEVAGGVHYLRSSKLVDGSFTVVSTVQSVAPEFPANEAAAAQKIVRALADVTVALRMAKDSASGNREQKSALSTPVTANDYVLRGGRLFNRQDWAGAVTAFDAALKIDPRNVDALARRGFAYAWLGNDDAAAADLNTAAVLDPEDFDVLRGRGYLAQKRKHYAEALSFYTRALKIDPEAGSIWGWRAQVHRALGDSETALSDAATSTRLSPDWVDMYDLRAVIYKELGQPEKALGEAKAAVAANPEDSLAHHEAALIYAREGKREEAFKAVTRAIEIAPSAALFVLRADVQPNADVPTRLKDLDTALRYDPTHRGAVRDKVMLQHLNGDDHGAVVTLSNALRHMPTNVDLLSLRAELLDDLGQRDEAARDLVAARTAAKSATDFNYLCWNGASTDVDLAASLQDCEKALSVASDESLTFTSRGHILLKMGRLDEARSSYDRSLMIDATASDALFGRAIVWRRKGDKVKSAADLAAARKITPDIADMLRSYGLTP